jgi:hypothetical protein
MTEEHEPDVIKKKAIMISIAGWDMEGGRGGRLSR